MATSPPRAGARTDGASARQGKPFENRPAADPLEALVRAAARICNADSAYVVSTGGQRESVRYRVGTSFPEIARDSRLATTADPARVSYVQDASADDRFRHDELVVRSPGIRFMAAIPWSSGAGRWVLYLIRFSPAALDEDQLAMLDTIRLAGSDMLLLRDQNAELRQQLDEHKHLSENAGKRNELLEAVIEGTTDAVFAKDLDGRYVMINRAGANLLGRPAVELLGHRDAELFPRETADRLTDKEREVVATKISHTYEYRHATVAGERIFQTVKGPYLDRDGRVVGLIGIAREITALREASDSLARTKQELERRVAARTSELEASNQTLQEEVAERRRAVDALRQSEEKFRLIAESVSDLIAMVDTEGNCLYSSPSYRRFFGIESATFDFFESIHEQDREHVRQAIGYAAATGKSRRLQYRVLQDGQPARVAESECSAVPEEGKAVSKVVFVSRDITDRIRSEESLRQANEQLTRAVEELQQRTRENVALNQMTDLMQTCDTLEQAHKVFGQYVEQLFSTRMGALFLFDAKSDELLPVAIWGTHPEAVTGFTKGECVALKLGKAHVAPNARSALLCKHLPDPPPAAGYLCVPMIADGAVLGSLYLEFESEPPGLLPLERRQWLDSRQRWAGAVAEHVALTLTNLQLREKLRLEAIHDGLTGLFNKRHMREVLQREVRRYNRHQRLLGIMMIDIDFFKRVNDKYGHETGDEVLRTVGQFLKESVRADDIACRYGGEEFLLIMPEASLEGLKQRAEALREGVKKVVVPRDGEGVGGLSISIGISVLPEHGSTVDMLVKAADTALYKAKREGRDCVRVAE